MEGRVVLITGSTDRIGKQTTLDLARIGPRVLLHGRSRQKGETAKKEIREKSGNDKIGLFIADLSSMS
jgi:short-subunit dehydrogenase